MIAILPLLLLAAAPTFEPTENYEVRDVEGWKVYVNKRLLADEPRVAEDSLATLRAKLFEINRVVPGERLEALRKVAIWLELDDDRHNPCACYHVDGGWLRGNGYNPDKTKTVEICNAKTFLKWIRSQPWMILHELAHAYHDQVLGYDDARIAAAHKRALELGKYGTVLRYSGKQAKHYAANNPVEYFAEATEAYFGTNDYFPFVRAELREYDPEIYRLLKEIWGDEEP